MLWMQVLIVAWLLHIVAGRSRVFSVVVALFALIPFGEGDSLATAMRGLWGDPSITSLPFLALAMLDKTPMSLRHGWRLPAFVAVIGVALTLSALGPWNIDLYRLGYQPAWLVGMLGIVAVAAWWRENALCLWLLAIDLFVWQAGWLASTNLWDYLLDPLLVIVMFALAIRNTHRRRHLAGIIHAR
jgi:hypothetical protein